MIIQGVLFVTHAALVMLCVAIGWRYPWARGITAIWLLVAANTAAFYLVAFILWPERVGEEWTMLWSVALRMHVAMTIAWRLIMVARRRG